MRFIFLSLLTFCLTSCASSNRVKHLDNFVKLEFGKGGGFAGTVETYTIDAKGKVSVYNSFTDSTQTVVKLKKKEMKVLLQELSALNIDSLQFNYPGNFYYFVKYSTSEGKEERIVWGDMNYPVPNKVKTYYQKLFVRIPEVEEK